MPQLNFSLRAGRCPGQQRLGSRTTRMLEVDLHDLEREAAQNNDIVFAPLGVSYLREQFDQEFGSIEPDVPLVIPSATSTVARLVKERNELLCRLMSRSSEWVRSLGDIAGGVIVMKEREFTSEESRQMFVDGRVDEIPFTERRIGTPADPWALLREQPFPFPDPMFREAVYDDDAEAVQISPPYRDLCPWLWNDWDEMKVVQWTVDRLGWPPWPRSFLEYEYHSKKHRRRAEADMNGEDDVLTMTMDALLPPDINDPDLPPEFREIYIRAATARSQRQKEFRWAHEPKAEQAHFQWSHGSLSPVC